ncbi:GTP-binding protein, partial [bacterium]|nr:GTP-binding protein [bacterium]
SKKIALLGSHAVGKTSLISQFIYQKFPESYLTTIGLKVDKKTIEIDGYRVDLVIWDIAGQENASNVPHYYLKGCSGIIYVVDLTRPSTYSTLESQLVMLRGMVGDAEIEIAANKKDLLNEEELEKALEEMPIQPTIVTSAKLGENVEEMFITLAKQLILKHESQES